MSGTTRRNKPGRSQRPRCVLPTGTSCRQDFQRNLVPADAGDGVSTYLALTFGTLLSSQGTDASFGLPSRASSGRFPSVLRFRLYQILSAPIFAGAIRPFGFFAVPTLPDPFPSPAPCWSGVSAVSLSLFGLSDFIRSSFVPGCFSKSCGRFEFRSELPVGGACLSAFPKLSEAFRSE